MGRSVNDRIKLAEAMGWNPGWVNGWKDKEQGKPANIWSPPNFEGSCWHGVDELPDPFTDANDTEALIRWLNERGYWVEIHWQPDKDEFGETMAAGAYVHIWHRDTEQHARQDYDRERWKECVCDLALKAIQSEQ